MCIRKPQKCAPKNQEFVQYVLLSTEEVKMFIHGLQDMMNIVFKFSKMNVDHSMYICFNKENVPFKMVMEGFPRKMFAIAFKFSKSGSGSRISSHVLRTYSANEPGVFLSSWITIEKVAMTSVRRASFSSHVLTLSFSVRFCQVTNRHSRQCAPNRLFTGDFCINSLR